LALVLGLASVVTVAAFFIPRTLDSSTANEATTSNIVAVDPAAMEVVDQFSSIGGDVLGGFSGGRLTHWKVSWELIKSHPWFPFDSLSLRWLRPVVGYGPDLFRYTYLLESPAQGPDRSLMAPDHAHNYFVHQTVEQGFLGTISSLGIFAAVFLAGAHRLLRSKSTMDPVHKLVLIALMSVLAGRALEMMVGVARISDLTVLWVVLGLFAALSTAMKSPELQHSLVAGSENKPSANHGRAESPSRTKAGVWPRLWKIAVVIGLIGTIVNLTWTNGISYPRAAVQAGHALKYFRQGNLPSSMSAIDRAVKLAPDVPVYHNWKALVFSAYRRDLSGPREQHCSSQGDLPYQTCLAALAHRSNLNGANQRPFYLQSRIALANSAFNLDLDDESIRYRRESLGMVPGSWGLRNNLASALIQQGKADSALEPLQEALEITKGARVSIDTLIIRARAYVDLGRYQDAIVDLNRALEIQASSAEAHAGLAVAYAKLGQDEKAHDAADRAVELGANRDVMDKAIEDIRQRR
jgi:tetratricopeptide (TPR) repeat protein